MKKVFYEVNEGVGNLVIPNPSNNINYTYAKNGISIYEKESRQSKFQLAILEEDVEEGDIMFLYNNKATKTFKEEATLGIATTSAKLGMALHFITKGIAKVLEPVDLQNGNSVYFNEVDNKITNEISEYLVLGSVYIEEDIILIKDL